MPEDRLLPEAAMRPHSEAPFSSVKNSPLGLWAIFLFVIFSAFILFSTTVLRSGYPVWDPFDVLKVIQMCREGSPWVFEATSGALHRILLAGFLSLFGPSAVGLFGANLLILAFESILLWNLVRRDFRDSSALAAVAFNLFNPMTLARVQAPLAYAALPCELLFLLLILPKIQDRFASLLFGAACGFCFLEYEGWVFGYPVLVLAYFFQPREKRPRFWQALLGFFLTFSWILWESRDWLESYWQLRLSPHGTYNGSPALSNLALHLKCYFWGQGNDLYLGPSAAMAPWTWVLLLAGVYVIWLRGPRWYLLWAASLLPILATHSSFPEAQRAISAWPVLCLFVGVGGAWLWHGLGRLGSWRTLCLASILAPAMGQALEYQDRLVSNSYPYEHWDRYQLAAEILRARAAQGPIEVLTDLNSRNMAEARLLLPPSRPNPKEYWALISQDFIVLPPDSKLGTWINLGPGARTWDLALLRLKPDQVPLFEAREHWLRALWRGQPLWSHAALAQSEMRQELQQAPSDFWLRQACLERYMSLSLDLKRDPRDWMRMALAEPRPGSWTLCLLAQGLSKSDPALALALAKRSQALYPIRPNLSSLISDLERATQR